VRWQESIRWAARVEVVVVLAWWKKQLTDEQA
jgi:hypothetical protein